MGRRYAAVPKVKLIASTPEPLRVIKTAISQCYQKEATDATVKHILKAGHLSVLEHASASFHVTCSLTVLLQMTRHRHLSFTVESSRGSTLSGVARSYIDRIDHYNQQTMTFYNEMIADGIRPENAAYVLPKATLYRFVVTGNFRAWYEYLPKRLCKRASKEHQKLAQLLHNELCLLCPEIFCHVKANCAMCNERSCDFYA